MVPSYRHSVSSLMPLNLNEDQNYELYSPNQYHSSSSSSSVSSASLSYPILLQVPDQDQHQEISYYSTELRKPLQNEVAEKIIPSSGSWDDLAAENQQSSSTKRKLRVWKKERDENLQLQEAAEPEIDGGSSVKWMSSKMRVMQKMMVSDQHKFEDQEQPSSPLGTDTSNNNNNNNNYSNSNHTVRVCSDCHTTKTPLWRSGPRGPKSLCNACGIRQRKARRAMAAAAAAGANGTTVVAAETTVKKNKLQKKKENKSKFEVASSTYMNKKKHKLGVGTKPISDHSQSRKKLCFEDLRLSLINNLALQQVFPQDEKEEAAILLMALSYGLVHG